MKLWSHGLGKRELKMDFRRCEIRRKEDGGIEILGIITEPVTWEYCITFDKEDVAGLIKMACNPKLIALVLNHSPSFFSYLRHRKEFAPEEGLADKVHNAYKEMMDRAGRMDAWRKRKAEQKASAASEGADTQGAQMPS